MAKFNEKNTNLTTNLSGHKAYKMEDKLKLVHYVLTSLFGEEKYYGDTTNELVKTAEIVCKAEPKFVSNLARYARKEFHLRSVSHALTSIVAHTVESKPYIGVTVNDVVERADDLTEILACYINMYGKPIPNGLKKALANNLRKFNEFQISKYNGADKKVKFKDILKLTHIKPKTEDESKLFKKILEDKLAVATRWETEVSANGNNEQTWEELIEKNQLGYMAMLRNLRNIINAQPKNIDKVIEKLTNKNEVLRSKQLPFRFYSAYREIEKLNGFKDKYLDALETALDLSIENMPKIKGKTVIAIDASGSMSSTISFKSDIRCWDLSCLLGVMASKFCEEALVLTFSSSFLWNRDDKSEINVVNVSKRGGIIEQAKNIKFTNGGTPMEAPFKYIIGNKIFADRIIILSDNETNCTEKTIQSFANQYRNLMNKDFWVHAIDLQGYGTQQFCGKNTNFIAGWSEKIFNFINLAEEGETTLLKTIENY